MGKVKGTERKNIRWIRDEVHEMKDAIDFYRKIAEHSFERGDYKDVGSQAKDLLSTLGEKTLFPGDLEKNTTSMRSFILSLKKLEEGRFKNRRDLEANYYASMFYSYKVYNELCYFLKTFGLSS